MALSIGVRACQPIKSNLQGIKLKNRLTELIEVVWLTFVPWLSPRLYDFFGLQKLSKSSNPRKHWFLENTDFSKTLIPRNQRFLENSIKYKEINQKLVHRKNEQKIVNLAKQMLISTIIFSFFYVQHDIPHGSSIFEWILLLFILSI